MIPFRTAVMGTPSSFAFSTTSSFCWRNGTLSSCNSSFFHEAPKSEGKNVLSVLERDKAGRIAFWSRIPAPPTAELLVSC
jgi:hypothetical protein